MKNKKFIVMYSGGIGSWAAAKRIVDKYGSDKVTCLFSDVKGNTIDDNIGEDPDTYRFIDDSIKNLNCNFVRVADGRNIWELFKDQKFLGNSRVANCSKILKARPAKKWLLENTNPKDYVIVIGIDWSEIHRIEKIKESYKPYNVIFPMTKKPYLDKKQMIELAEKEGLKPPRLYSLGFSHNNCGGGCVKAGQGQFKLLLDTMPERYNTWMEKEKEIIDYIGKDVSILTELKDGIKKKLPLYELKNRNDKDIDKYDIGGCNCFIDGEDLQLNKKPKIKKSKKSENKKC